MIYGVTKEARKILKDMKRVHKTTITCEFGSDWQEEVQLEMLEVMLKAFKLHAESKHKKNKVTVTTEEIK